MDAKVRDYRHTILCAVLPSNTLILIYLLATSTTKEEHDQLPSVSNVP